MIDQYTIYSIDDKRLDSKIKLREAFSGLREIDIECVNGNVHEELEHARDKWNIKITSPFKRGEYGIWFTTLNAWEYALNNGNLLTLEDDAIPTLGAQDLITKYLEDAPSNIDFLSVFVPDNQKLDFRYDVTYNNGGVPNIAGTVRVDSKFEIGHPYICRVYQTYSGVAQIYTQRGARRMINIARKTGINQPIDCWLMAQAHAGYINGYALKPQYTNVIDYNWNNETTIHRSEYLHFQDEEYK